MKKKVKKVNVLGPRLKHKVQRTFNAVMRNKGSLADASCTCDGGGDAGGGNCSGGGADCANCGNCSNN